jgi:4-hydroxy-3-methylbut-2-enyl diphosphate reductase
MTKLRTHCQRLAAFGSIVVGINVGASGPNNLIEETLLRLFELRAITRVQLELAA